KGPRSTPVFPPTEASTIDKRVVGTLIKSIPLLKQEATKPPRSVTTPPPRFIIALFLSASNSDKTSQTCVQVPIFLLISPSSISTISKSYSPSILDIKIGRQQLWVFSSTRMNILE